MPRKPVSRTSFAPSGAGFLARRLGLIEAIAREKGFEIDIRPTAGSVETLEMLKPVSYTHLTLPTNREV